MYQSYCQDFPDDACCPRPACTTFGSVEMNPEYCDRKACKAFLLPVDTVDKNLLKVCDNVCSRHRLGGYGTTETSTIRGACRGLCRLDGPERSYLCLTYCRDFPDDPLCPSFEIINALLARRVRTKGPSVSPTPSPSGAPSTPFAPLEESAFAPVLSTSQLQLGSHRFLGYCPHEQMGTYMRNPSKCSAHPLSSNSSLG